MTQVRFQVGTDGRSVRTVRRWTLAWIAVMLTLGAALGTAGPAAAHTELVTADPAQDATVSTLDVVRLRFTDPLRPEFSALAVTSTDGALVVSGSPAVAGTEISLPVTVTGAGSYTVAYRVISADGHPVEGSYAVIFAPSPVATPSPAATPSAPPRAAEPNDVATSGAAAQQAGDVGGMTLVGFGAGLLACAGLVGAGLVWRRRMREHA